MLRELDRVRRAPVVQAICGLITVTARVEAEYNPWALLRDIIGVGLASRVSAHPRVKAGAHCAEVCAETVAVFVPAFTLLAIG